MKLYLGHLKARRMYGPAKSVLGYSVWEPWMDTTIQKLTDELYIDE